MKIAWFLLLTLSVFAKEQQRWGVLPALSSNKETGIQLGALVMHFLPKEDSLAKAKDIGFAVVFSQKKQLRMVFFPNIYWDKNQNHFQGGLEYQNWPANYYGTGFNTTDSASKYTTKYTKLSLDYSRAFGPLLWLGGEYAFHYDDLSWNTDPERFRADAGYDGNRLSGVGVFAALDQRDFVNAPTKGFYVENRLKQYHKGFGSDFNFLEWSFDSRFYQPVVGNTLAFGLFSKSQSGKVPFRHLASPDGDKRHRGIEKGRYRDKNLLELQSEWRSKLIIWNIGYVAFGEMAQVASSLNSFDKDNWIYSYGFGLRYALNPEECFHVRADLVWSEGVFTPVINIREAF